MNLNCFKVQLFKRVKKVQNNQKLNKIAKWNKLPSLFGLKKAKVLRVASLLQCDLCSCLFMAIAMFK